MAKKTYLNKGGEHRTENGQTVLHGESFESEADLCKLFPNKFEEVHQAQAASAPTPPPPPPPATTPPPKTNDEEVDVTSEFPLAVESGLKVGKVGKGWNLYDGVFGEGEDLINEKPIKKKDVVATIEEFNAEAEEE